MDIIINYASKVACGGTVRGTEDVQICTRALKEYPNGTPSNLYKSPEDALFAALWKMVMCNIMSLSRR